MPTIDVILTPTEIARLPERDLSRAVCVVFDVLRATSTILAALASGARRVVPALTIEEARALRDTRFPGALLGGERGGRRIEGFTLGNSPREYTAEVVAGRDIITTTTNGTAALRACAGAAAVYAGALGNLEALAAELRAVCAAGTPLLLVCAGTGQDFSLEDALAAGALLARLPPAGHAVGGSLGDAGRAALSLYEQHAADLAGAFAATDNGRRLVEIGLAEDVAWCAQVSRFGQLGVLRDGAMVGK